MTYPLRAVLIVCVFLALPLGGCGNKGPLFIPDPTTDKETEKAARTR